ncbi:glutaredoxin [Candidatus Kaiserbacteria bacterium]|nr:glutaredoxin [Candidatus Kaiserbacteria bacterium]USN88787.1 MAG: glutaredoxin [Candidatus Nomurabacteria bacterium]
MRKILASLGALVVLFGLFTSPISAQEEAPMVTENPTVFIFGRDDCGFCKKLFAWIETQDDLRYEYLNIVTDSQARDWYDQVAEKHEAAKITPITVVGERVIAGFDGPDTTGASIRAAVEAAKKTDINSIQAHLERAPQQEVILGGGCTDLECELGTDQMGYIFDLPFFGVVDLKSFSLFSLSAILGVIDGFNPCAMWVLITFLVILSQAGSRQKMIFLAGIFIVAEAIMYNLILNVWYKTWDFIALDQYVTPFVGVLALGGGIFFLHRWNKNKSADLVCDITDIESQSRTIDKFKAIVNQPVTIASIAAILVIAFSVNIIEFACSIGIPQAYTKILELNMLTFMERQWYIFIYTIGYMVDDLIVFGLAIWGYGKLQSHGGKYAQLSLLIGGLLMLLLGAVLVVNPALLVL